jgi:CubicO group peptidase (beta-lactamase class C family)
MPASLSSDLDQSVDRGLRDEVFPGIACGVWKDGRLRYSRFSGFRDLEPEPRAIESDTLFDLASLTKPLSTAILLMRAREKAGFELSEPLGRFLPEVAPGTTDLRLLDILTHTSGLPAIPALERFFPDPAKIDPELARRRLLEIGPERPAGKEVVYSCTGYLLLGLALERITGLSLPELFRRELALPLGLSAGSGFLPDAERRERAAATEYCAWRGRRVRGEVHDESAYCMGGAAGNAGLFATLGDVAKIASIFLDGGRSPGGETILGPESIRLMCSSLTEGLNRWRAVGWAMHDGETLDGPDWPPASFGHTGFTGTSVFIEPRSRLLVVALTNRVYYGREATAESMPRFRREFHSAAIRAFGA